MMLLFWGSYCWKFETVQSFEPTFLLFRDRRSVALQCWIRLHSSSKIDWTTHAHCTWFTKSNGLYPSHHALQVPTVLGIIATVCTPLPTQTKNVGSCCVRLHVALLQILKLFFLWPDWGIKSPRLWNQKFSSRNLESSLRLESGIQVPPTRNPQSRIQSVGSVESKTVLDYLFFVRRGELLSDYSLTVMPTKQNKGNANSLRYDWRKSCYIIMTMTYVPSLRLFFTISSKVTNTSTIPKASDTVTPATTAPVCLASTFCLVFAAGSRTPLFTLNKT